MHRKFLKSCDSLGRTGPIALFEYACRPFTCYGEAGSPPTQTHQFLMCPLFAEPDKFKVPDQYANSNNAIDCFPLDFWEEFPLVSQSHTI